MNTNKHRNFKTAVQQVMDMNNFIDVLKKDLLAKNGSSQDETKLTPDQIELYEKKEVTWDVYKKATDNYPNYTTYRKLWVDTCLENIFKQLECDSNTNKCQKISTGSVSNISDYDINISGMESMVIFEKFHKIFEHHFGMNSAEKFDTNLYIKGFYTFKEKTLVSTQIFSYKTHHGHFLEYVRINEKSLIDNQRKWAWTKLFLHTQFLQNCDIGLITNIIPDDSKTLFKDLKTQTQTQTIQTYKEFVNPTFYKQFIDNANKSTTKLNYINNISNANFFADETYFTQGSFFLVVGKLQSKITFTVSELTKDMLIDCYIEHIGEIIKIYNELDELDSQPQMKMYVFLLKVSKYMYRLYVSLLHILKYNSNCHNNANICKIKNLLEILHQQRSESVDECIQNMSGSKPLCNNLKKLHAYLSTEYSIHTNINTDFNKWFCDYINSITIYIEQIIQQQGQQGGNDKFSKILNPNTMRYVSSSGNLGKQIIKNYNFKTIMNPLTKKFVKSQGRLGKQLLKEYNKHI